MPRVSSGEPISGCGPPGRCQPPRPQEDVVSTREPAQTAWWRMPGSGAQTGADPCLLTPDVARLPQCRRWRGGPERSPLALLRYSLNPWLCEQARLKALFFFCSLVIPQFGLLSHVSCLRLSSGHAGPVLTLSTDYPARTSLSRPCLLMADFSIWATSLLAVAIRHIICVFFVSVFLPVMLPSEVPKLPTDPPVTGFPTVCKLLLLHSFLPRTGCLCP